MSLGPSRARQLRMRVTRAAHALRGLVRRLTIGRTGAGGLWQLLGYDGPDGEQETFDDAEVFPGVGIHARPRDGARAEVVVVHVGGEGEHPIVIATRDLSAQVAIEPDETVIFNSVASVKITKTGDIEIVPKAGQKVMLGGTGLITADGVVHGTGIDPFTGASYFALGNTSAVVRAKK